MNAVAVRARISERTPRDLRGVDLLPTGSATSAAGRSTSQGRREPFGETAWQDDLEASREVLSRAGGELQAAVERGEAALLVATDCSLALGTLPALHAAVPARGCCGSTPTPTTTRPRRATIGFLGCMSLAGATGAWDAGLGVPLPPGQVVLAGVRGELDDFDGAGRAGVDASPVTVIPPSPELGGLVIEALGDAPVYVHLDPDVLDPSENPVPYARPGGLALDAVAELLRVVSRRGPVVGVEITAFHTDDHRRVREALADALVECVRPLLG